MLGFEIRKGRPNTYCVWGDCDPDAPERRKDKMRGAGFAEVVFLDRAVFPACRRHRREIEEILASALPEVSDEPLEAVA